MTPGGNAFNKIETIHNAVRQAVEDYDKSPPSKEFLETVRKELNDLYFDISEEFFAEKRSYQAAYIEGRNDTLETLAIDLEAMGIELEEPPDVTDHPAYHEGVKDVIQLCLNILHNNHYGSLSTLQNNKKWLELVNKLKKVRKHL